MVPVNVSRSSTTHMKWLQGVAALPSAVHAGLTLIDALVMLSICLFCNLTPVLCHLPEHYGF